MSILGKDVSRLLLKIQNGDEQAKTDLYNLLYNHLKVIAWIYTDNKSDIEDVLSESFFRIFNYTYSYKYPMDGFNWACKIVERKSYDFNANKRDFLPIDSILTKEYFEEFEDKIIAKLDAKKYLEPYNERDRKIMYLRFNLDLKFNQIGKAMGISKSYAHKRVKIILAEIKERIKQEKSVDKKD